MYKSILVPTDGSKLSADAIKKAATFAKAIGAKLTAIHVMPDSGAYVNEHYNVLPALAAPLKKKYQGEAVAFSKALLDQACAQAAAAGIECARIAVTGDLPYEAIIDQAAKSKCDLIVMASHGRKGLQGILLGSETQKVLTHSKIPVLVLR